jgi:hypothetical protein
MTVLQLTVLAEISETNYIILGGVQIVGDQVGYVYGTGSDRGCGYVEL